MSKLLVFAGPNGSGKSTITSDMKFFENYADSLKNYVNADSIKKGLHCSDLEAAQIAEATREHYLAKNLDFAFETVLSTRRNIDLMIRAKEKGYHISCIYVLTSNPQINIARVHERVLKGEHSVPDDKVYSRYIRALGLLPMLFPICNELYAFDNSLDVGSGTPGMLIRSINGNIEAYTTDVWNADMIKSLICGKYPKEYILDSD